MAEPKKIVYNADGVEFTIYKQDKLTKSGLKTLLAAGRPLNRQAATTQQHLQKGR